ncbi:MAG: recombination mediator RecR [Elusimicrobiales bacterium]|nr:recombination mediator RecR [Elusimicrobiales bacterium]
MKSIDRLKTAFRRLPGVGPRQAERFAVHFLRASNSEAQELIAALKDLKASIRLCKRCFAYSETDICRLCADPERDPRSICVVEEAQDIEVIEKTRTFNGYYHVLHGALSPLEGAGPAHLKIAELVERVKTANGAVEEVIIATDPDTEGEATALYLAQALRGLTQKISRIGYGVPLGADLDYTDELTLGHALRGRTSI